MSDLRDPEYAERFESGHPDAYLRRREFLQRTALTAGLATSFASVLSPDTLVAEAARKQRQQELPSPTNIPIDTIVVLMNENRSFDHYLGWLPGADGHQAGLSFADKQGVKHQTHRLTPDFQGCAFNDPDHSWEGGRTQLDGGKCDGFLRSGNNDEFSIGYYAEGDLGFIQDAAKAFTTFDRFHCSLMGSTLPNREYMHAAQSYGQVDNNLPPEIPGNQTGFPDSTIFNALSAAGVSNRYFFNDVPVAALWGAPGVARSGYIQEYYERAASGTLPSVSYVDPNFGGSAGEGPGVSADEHPHGDVRAGQAFMSDVVHAFMESPQWKTGALFIVYDEWGGFFDHVRPPRVPDIRNDKDINKDYGLMGFRIPAICVSPFARRGFVNHTIFGFESILKFIEYRFGLKPLTRRDAYANNIGRALDFASKPKLELPSLPRPQDVVSVACASQGYPQDGPRATIERPKEHDLMDMVTSGYLDRLGFDYRQSTLDSTFREPSKVRQAYVP